MFEAFLSVSACKLNYFMFSTTTFLFNFVETGTGLINVP